MPDAPKAGLSLLALTLGPSGFDEPSINAKAGFEADSEGALLVAKLKAGFVLLAESDTGRAAAAGWLNMFDAVEVVSAKSDVLGSSFEELRLTKRLLLLGFSSVEEAPKFLFAGGSEASGVLNRGRLVFSTVEVGAAPNEGLVFSSVASATLTTGLISGQDMLEALNKGFGASAVEVMEVDVPVPKSGLESPFPATPDPNERAAVLFSVVHVFAELLVSEALLAKIVEEPIAGTLVEGGKSSKRWPLDVGACLGNSEKGAPVVGLEAKAPEGANEEQAAESSDAVADLAMFNAGFGSSEDSIGWPMDLKNTLDAGGAEVVSAFDSELDSTFASISVACSRLAPPRALDSGDGANEVAGMAVVLASSV